MPHEGVLLFSADKTERSQSLPLFNKPRHLRSVLNVSRVLQLELCQLNRFLF